ncbi:MAG: glycosyltransferase [Chloroflexi bacterium]|nr:glycosyltransferase [Chloroflexota bacterium]
MDRITLSVLICTYNRHETLQRALTALVEGTEEKPDQIVVVNGGDERADKVVRAFLGRHGIDIQLVNTVNKNLAASRNIGLPHCSGDIVAMTDDDAEVYPDWVTQIKRVHSEYPNAGAVGGPVLGASSDSNFISRLADIATFPSPPTPVYVRTVPGVNASYKREVLEKVGNQDETLFRGEDVDFNWRVKRLGWEVLYHPAIKVRHHHRPTLGQLLHQHYMYGRAYYLVRRKWPEMYCVYPHVFKSLRDYLKAAHFVIASVYQPVVFAMQFPRWWDRVRAIPVLITIQIVWKGGMLRQKLLSARQPENRVTL